MTKAQKLKLWHLIICTTIIAIVTTTLVFNALSINDSFNGAIKAIKSPTKLKMSIPISYRDTTWVNINKDDSLWILGMQGSLQKSRLSLWVQDANGNRGFIPVEKLGIELKAINKRSKKLETISVIAFDYDFSKYYCKFPDGSTAKISNKDVYPQISEDLKLHYINPEGPKITLSDAKFKRLIMGKTISEADQLLYPAKTIIRRNDSLIASFDYVDVIDYKGSRLHTHPIVSFNGNGIATNCEFRVYNSEIDKHLIRYVPFVKNIIDADILANTIKSPLWSSTFFVEDAPPSLQQKAIAIIYFIVFGLLWLWLTPLLPIAVIGLSIHQSIILKPIDNLPLRIIIITLITVASFVWFVMILIWGYLLPFLIINVVIAFIGYKYIASPLDNYIPHDRCLNCRNLFSMNYIDQKFDHEYTEWEKDHKFAKTLHKSYSSYRTWTHVTYRTSSGQKGSYDKDFKTHTISTTTSLYDEYEVQYKIEVFKITFRCSVCGKEEYDYSYRKTELNRRYVGQKIYTNSRED